MNISFNASVATPRTIRNAAALAFEFEDIISNIWAVGTIITVEVTFNGRRIDNAFQSIEVGREWLEERRSEMEAEDTDADTERARLLDNTSDEACGVTPNTDAVRAHAEALELPIAGEPLAASKGMLADIATDLRWAAERLAPFAGWVHYLQEAARLCDGTRVYDEVGVRARLRIALQGCRDLEDEGVRPRVHRAHRVLLAIQDDLDLVV